MQRYKPPIESIQPSLDSARQSDVRTDEWGVLVRENSALVVSVYCLAMFFAMAPISWIKALGFYVPQSNFEIGVVWGVLFVLLLWMMGWWHHLRSNRVRLVTTSAVILSLVFCTMLSRLFVYDQYEKTKARSALEDRLAELTMDFNLD